MKFIAKIFFEIKDYIEQKNSYQNYISHQKKFHPDAKILDKKTFYKNRLKEKWNKINRCC